MLQELVITKSRLEPVLYQSLDERCPKVTIISAKWFIAIYHKMCHCQKVLRLTKKYRNYAINIAKIT